MESAIAVENLSKRYRIGVNRMDEYRTLREAITDGLASCWGRFRGQANSVESTSGTHWALKDISFEVQPGEVVGIIGRNGAGKSTLLKILSRITEPTSGRCKFRGRIGSLLEVGTGFHPELTGRENIYLNGSILGMSRREIDRKFDEIVEFAEIERFLDTPVKRYSSGMYVRLAFGVAAHMEPEILLVDEVLAVGDLNFQKKCLGKIDDVGKSGRTVLLVSHNMASILHLAQKVVFLDQGRLEFEGDSEEGVRRYTNRAAACAHNGDDLLDSAQRKAGSEPILKSVHLVNSVGEPTNQVLCGESVAIELEVDARYASSKLHFAVGIDDSHGSRLMTASTYHTPYAEQGLGESTRVLCRLEQLPLKSGRYALTLYAGPIYAVGTDVIEQAIWFDVIEADFYGNGRLPRADWGQFLVRSEWSSTQAL